MVRKSALLTITFLALACGDRADTLNRDAEVGLTEGTEGTEDAAADSAAGRDTVTGDEPAAPMDAGVAPEPGARVARPGGNAADTRTIPDPDERRNIVFIGTSLTAGYGVGEENAWPAVIQEKIDSAGLPYTVVNAGVSGETSAGGLARLDWSLRNPVDVLVVELGANDGLRGLPVGQMRANLDSILVRTRRAYPEAALVIAGMEAPPNLGEAYTSAFRETFADLAELRDAALVPFLLEDVGGIREMNQADGIHPTAEGHRILAANVWEVLGPVLERRAAAGAGTAIERSPVRSLGRGVANGCLTTETTEHTETGDAAGEGPQRASMLFATNQTLAGRSASRRTYHGNHSSP